MAIRVSAIVSLYNAERFVRGALEDLVQQTLFKKDALEIVVVNSGSEQNEEAIVREFQACHPRIKYVRTERETIYGAWNRGIALSEGEFLTNANSDDRHRADALEVLADALARSGAGVAYADVFVTRGPNETFERHTADRVLDSPDYSLRQMLMHSLVGPQPVWRRDLHDRIGVFDPTYEVAGDVDFFTRVGWARGGHHVDQVLGLYWQGGKESQNAATSIEECARILRHYRTAIPIEDIYPACRAAMNRHAADAVARWDFARCLETAPHVDLERAARLKREAGVSLLRAGPLAWPELALRQLQFRWRGPYAGLDTGPWHPILADLPPVVGDTIRPI